MTSQVMKQSENILPPVVPVLKSKTRILSSVTNKDTSKVNNSTVCLKEARDRQRENAAKLASGRSVVSRADKENEGAFKKPIKVAPKPALQPKKLTEQKKVLSRSESLVSVYQQDAIKNKGRIPIIKKPDILVSGTKALTISQEPKVEPVKPKPQVEEEKKEVKEEVQETVEKEEKVERLQEDEEEEEIPLGVNIIDVDEDVQNAECILGIYARDIYRFMRHLEQIQNIRKDYLTTAHIMTQHMRAVLVDWIFEVQQSFRLLNETAQLSIALLDRFMQDHPGIVKEELQLVAVACIFLASKYEEMYPPDLEDLTDISANTYTKHEVLTMEQIIFAALDFQMGRPLPAQFLRRYGKAGSVDLITYCFSKYFIDLSLVHYAFCHIRPSLLAAACLYLSLYLTSDENTEFWTPTLAYYSQYSAETLRPLASKIASIVWQAPRSKFQNVTKKYLDPKRHHNISARSELKSEKLCSLAKESETCL